MADGSGLSRQRNPNWQPPVTSLYCSLKSVCHGPKLEGPGYLDLYPETAVGVASVFESEIAVSQHVSQKGFQLWFAAGERFHGIGSQEAVVDQKFKFLAAERQGSIVLELDLE